MAGFPRTLLNSIMNSKLGKKQSSSNVLYCLGGKSHMVKRVLNNSSGTSSATASTSSTSTNTTNSSNYSEFTNNGITYALYTFSQNGTIKTTEQIFEDDDLNILVIGAGGAGSSANTFGTYFLANTGGGGGGVGLVKIITPSSSVYECQFTIGSGGYWAGGMGNIDGLPGDPSYANIYKNGSLVYSINSNGGYGGEIINSTTSGTGDGGTSNYTIFQENLGAEYVFYKGGSGGYGDENGKSVTFIKSTYNETIDWLDYFPLNPLEYSSGGGGSGTDPLNQNESYYGGLGGGNQRVNPDTNSVDRYATNPNRGGNTGDNVPPTNDPTDRENGSILEGYGYEDNVVNNGLYGGIGLFPGCGGGGGGTHNKGIADEIYSGKGANGVIKVCIKKSSAHKII